MQQFNPNLLRVFLRAFAPSWLFGVLRHAGDDIRDWRVEPNRLGVNLLYNAKLGVKQYRDNEPFGDPFANDGIDPMN